MTISSAFCFAAESGLLGIVTYMLAFFGVFLSLFLSGKAASTLMAFLNTLLSTLKLDYTLPITLPTVSQRIGFSDIANRVRRMVVCRKCHAVYPNDLGDALRICTSVQYPPRRKSKPQKFCGEPLFPDNPPVPLNFVGKLLVTATNVAPVFGLVF